MKKTAIFRIRIITGVVVFLAVLLIVRLYYVQVIHSENYKSQAERQYVHTAQDLYSRGDIYFTSKDGELSWAAAIQPGYVLALDPTRITDPEGTYTALVDILPSIDHDSFVKKASDQKRTYQEINTQVSDTDADAIDVLDLPGVLLYRSQWRSYPQDNLAARTVGFVGYKGNDVVGLYGLERQYEDVLSRGSDKLSVNFFAELFSDFDNLVFDSSHSDEGDIITTLEPNVSKMLDEVLKKTEDKWKSKVTGGIIMNPRTGEIYAMNVVPTFNLNDRSGVSLEMFDNPLVEARYEMGSIIKPLTMAAGIDTNTVTPSTTYYDPGCIELNTYRICNFDKRGRGTVPMQEVLSQSLNTGVAHIVNLMGKEKLKKYFLGLKLGSETGIDLPGEIHGDLENLNSPRDVEYATASFGQGIAMTPIETVRALATLANDGRLVTPHIVKEIRYESGKTYNVQFPLGEQVFSTSTTDQVTSMLITVADKALAHGALSMEHYSFASKTGTAQIANPNGGGYYADRYLHSFFGYFPAYDPQFLIFLYTVEPQGVQYSSETLTEPYGELMRFLLNYYDVPPDR
ncbi:penicillin-binding protein 2 [Candidatus Parcubacteria bacterium]|uniref:Penicillin-binding protein transpeptidase domain-containing protein n=1 Tax=Candidatus Kaiserbacteria bacterium CG10_big_fil_rev_8_21_14_0_10_47_16 TaxID=1974608 RepID=A0A2H0UD63_9BACT|nr:penicillin-binding protein 2 [Candidatus Parcubacteria bacterium]PIR84327.1 MAG: hypothetical protein COU16_01895 [Candidatus Kaiserbacteria bacterium CG10_big_fil_rev_8_21_14_0_10_47_16]